MTPFAEADARLGAMHGYTPCEACAIPRPTLWLNEPVPLLPPRKPHIVLENEPDVC